MYGFGKYYSEDFLSDDIVTRASGTRCYCLKNSASHEHLISGVMKENASHKFRDPRPGYSGNLTWGESFIDEETHNVKGVNLYKGDEFCCSYLGEDYEDIIDSNEKDYAEKQRQIEKNYNIEKGAKRQYYITRTSPPKVVYDESELKKSFHYDIKEVKREENPELYEKYDSLINPLNGKELKCSAIYTNQKSLVHPEEKVKYVEFEGETRRDNYHYIEGGCSVDEQIEADRKTFIEAHRANQNQNQNQNQNRNQNQNKEQDHSFDNNHDGPNGGHQR